MPDNNQTEYSLFRHLIEQSSEEVYLLRPDLSIIFANRAAAHSLGVSRDDLSGANMADFDSYIALHRGGNDDIFQRLRRVKLLTFDTLHESKEGKRTFKRIKSLYFLHEDTEYVILYASDISGIMQSEVDILRREERFRNIFEQSIDGIFIASASGSIIEWNEKLAFLTGIPKIDAVDRNVRDVYLSLMPGSTQNEKNAHMEKFDSLLKMSRKGISVLDSFEIIFKSIDGIIHEVQHFVFPVTSLQDGGFLIGNIIRDITDRKRLEEERVRTQKIESLGILAGGIAHDFRNILSAVLGNITLAGMELDAAAPQRRYLTNAETAVLRAKELTSRLLTFSKGGEPVKSYIAVNELIEESANIILSGSNVSHSYQLDENIPNFPADKIQINQVIQNIIINALQAMKDGGRLEIATKAVTLNDNDAAAVNPGTYAMISISDDGAGIPKEHIEKIFDPYFTTKADGTGLGLSVVYSIIKKHEGNITVESVPGKTTFRIYLPIMCSPGFRTAKYDEFEESPLKGSGHILVIDDEDIVRTVIKSLLKSIGYSAESTSTVEEGLHLYSERFNQGKRFNAVIMDLTIKGGVSGRKGVQLFKEKYPDSKIIVASGYSNDPVLSRFEDYGFFDAIVKPIELKELSRILKRAVG